MTDIWIDEAAEYLGGGSDDNDDWFLGEGLGEDIDFGDMFDEASRVRDHRREDPRRAAVARRRQLEVQRRARTTRRVPARPVTARTAIRNTRAAVRHVDLENRVRADAFGGAVRALGRRSTGLERTTSAAAVVNTLKNELDNFENDLGEELTNALKTVADFVPLVFLRSPEKGLRNPPVVAGLAGIGIALAGLVLRRVTDDGDVDVDLRGNALAAPRGSQGANK